MPVLDIPPLDNKSSETEVVYCKDMVSKKKHIAARVLATYLIPGYAGRGVRLGSENSSGGAGGVWAQAWAKAWAQARAKARAQAGPKLRPSWAPPCQARAQKINKK